MESQELLDHFKYVCQNGLKQSEELAESLHSKLFEGRAGAFKDMLTYLNEITLVK